MSTLLDSCLLDCNYKCNENAECKNIASKQGCYCKNGYTGDGINHCEDDDECQNATMVCGDNATCTNIPGKFFCTCKSGFQSSGQEKFEPNDGTTCVENSKASCHLSNDCISGNINKTLEEIKKIKEPINQLKEVNNRTKGELSPVDIITYVEALFQYAPCLNGTNDMNTTINVFVNTVNSFVREDEMKVWNKIAERDRKKSITKLLHTVEQTTLGISQNFKKTTQLEFNASDLALKVVAFDLHHPKHVRPHANLRGDFIELLSKKKDEANSNGTVAVVFLRYENIGSLLKQAGISQDDDDDGVEEPKESTVNSPIIAAAVSSNPPTLYQIDQVIFILKHLQVWKKNGYAKCAFWNYSQDTMQGQWSTKGCERQNTNATHTTCKCNHLTHFAILMSSARFKDVDNYTILKTITQLGIIISLICLSMCIFTFWFFSEIQSTRTTIHKNLCCSLFLAELLFLVGINMNTNKVLCSIIAGLLHYFFLAAFAWMCIEGIHLYLIVVGVIYNKGFLHRNFYIFGYGSPAVVVGISAILGYKYYGTDKVCWLSTENNFIWSFIGPACLIILVNLLAFGVIIYKVFRHTTVLKPEVSCYENIRSCARGALALFFLLGATWMFGVLHVVHESVITAYLFTISNVFQGMFIFIFLCVLSKKIQEEYYRLFRNVPCCFGCLR
nr:PREDICTED: adhesion G protein-coupled receptor L4 [Latimeria chalumnae]|eukprot:XP_014345683.1 PREDICTED: adhesion G protein-coupled receptor L4 [Latimeria chalumnae]